MAASEGAPDLGHELFDLAETLNEATIQAATVYCLVEGLVEMCSVDGGGADDLKSIDFANVTEIANGLRKQIKEAHEHLERVRPHSLTPRKRVAEEE